LASCNSDGQVIVISIIDSYPTTTSTFTGLPHETIAPIIYRGYYIPKGKSIAILQLVHKYLTQSPLGTAIYGNIW
jgi:hypothetical protein